MSTANPSTTGETQGMRQRTEELADRACDMGHDAAERAQEQVEMLRERAMEYYEQGRARAMELENTLENQIRQQPVKSILIAAGVGLALGVLWARR